MEAASGEPRAVLETVTWQLDTSTRPGIPLEPCRRRPDIVVLALYSTTIQLDFVAVTQD